MRFNVVAKTEEKIKDARKALEKEGFEYSDKPEIVFCIGGDGTFLIAERRFPGILKVLTRDSKTCKNCHEHTIEEISKVIKAGKYKIREIRKIKAIFKGKELIGVNDVVLRNSLPTEALRFSLLIDGKTIAEEVIGDGLVISTPYGSGAYFNSITRKKFEKGIGIAFNNAHEEKAPVFLNGDEKIEVEINRGPGVLVSDNNREFVELNSGDKFVVQEIDEVARVVVL